MEVSFLRVLAQLLFVSVSNIFVSQVTQAAPQDPNSPVTVSVTINPMSAESARAQAIIADLVRERLGRIG